MDISGGYLNPVLASSMQFGCSGSTLLEHLQVYWVADTLGTLLAYYLDTGLGYLFSMIFKRAPVPASTVDEKHRLTGKTD
jgi:hypothetical protein